MIAMLGIGFGQITGTILNGQIQDRFGAHKTILVNIVLNLLCFWITLMYLYVGSFSMPFAMACTFSWGMIDGGLNNFIYCMCGFQFDSKLHPFSVLLCVQSIFAFSCIYIESLLTTLAHVRTFILCSGVFTAFGWALFAGFFELREAKTEVVKKEEDYGLLDDIDDVSQASTEEKQ